MKTRKKTVVITVLVIFMVLACFVLPMLINYFSGIKLMNNGQFEEASENFKALGGLFHAEAFEDYCRARKYAAEGDYSMAAIYLYQVEHRDKLYSTSHLPDYDAFQQEVEEQQKIAMENAIKRREERYQEQVRTGVPFVDMKESDIGRTTLGRPNGTPWHNYSMERGQRVEATIYDWIRDDYVVYSARCMHGMVVQVWDYRAKPWKKVKSSTTTHKKATTSAKKDSDPLEARTYSNPEDFYDDNYYDFFDYEEAEDYYYEHGGQ